MTATADMLAAIDGDAGYAAGPALSAAELAQVRRAIERQWLAHLGAVAPEHAAAFGRIGLDRYHELADRLDHASVWPKRSRLLPPEVVAAIRRMSFFRRIEEELGDCPASDEDHYGWEEIYWRLVRPQAPGDIGPLHADGWFWDLGDAGIPADRRRIKLWVAVIAEPGRNGLRLVPGSHRREWRHHGEWRDGRQKPVLDENEADLDIRLFPANPGECVLFHDRLLHGGALNLGTTTRVSFELTLLPRQRACRHG